MVKLINDDIQIFILVYKVIHLLWFPNGIELLEGAEE